MKKIELLSPVGNIDCLHAAVQNGADSIYFGSNLFNARAYASNFSDESLKEAITYAKLRGVKTHLTLNTLILNNEFKDAVKVAKQAYEYGIDAIIVQDLGLALYLIKNFPDLPIHASTQMTVHNLDGVLTLQNLGFKRVVLSRELRLNDIKYICEHSNIEIETFIHGALCISYSGQCLFSSLVGGRSGNRGKCAQPCRLPYTLIDEYNNKLDKGYLLSPRDLCGLDFIPDLINAGVSSLKIEGRMKSPEYVAIVTNIYRKYIDLAYSNNPYIVDSNDKKLLALAFNRGGFSNGHLTENKNLIFKEKPNNMGLFLGTISKYDSKKGLISLKLNEKISIGDSISVEKENNLYNISELMINNINKKICNTDDYATIGRMKGNINIGDKVYKMADKQINLLFKKSFDSNTELKKIPLNAKIILKLNKPVELSIYSDSNLDLYKNLNVTVYSTATPQKAINNSLNEKNIITQISKIKNTPYKFSNINVELENNLFLPNSVLNELKRNAINQLQNIATNKICRTSNIGKFELKTISNSNPNSNAKISLLLNILDVNADYSKLKNITNIYIPLKYFINDKFANILHVLENNFRLYIYLPTIMKNNYTTILNSKLDEILNNFNIVGFVISNLSGFNLIDRIKKNYNFKYNFIGNYTLNVYNSCTANNLLDLGLNTITFSPELNRKGLEELCNTTNNNELIVYGNIPVMNTNYCLFGKTNNCNSDCVLNNSKQICKTNEKLYLKDRLNFNFRIIPDNIDTVTTIYNSKTYSIDYSNLKINSVRIDILNETIDEINSIVDIVNQKKKLEGNNYTNGNLNREI